MRKITFQTDSNQKSFIFPEDHDDIFDHKYPIDPGNLFSIEYSMLGAQWLSGRVLDSRPKGRGFEPHRRHCVVVLEQDTFILA